MSIKKTFMLAALGLSFATASLASGPVTLGWDDLAPKPVQYSNPFEDLSSEQMSMLKDILRSETQDQSAATRPTTEKSAELRAQLKAEGLDVDWLFEQRTIIMEQRRAAAVGVNPEVVGTTIRMPGYILPLNIQDQKVTEFLLVPTVGACIHTPPPPANQIVHVQYPEGIEIKGLYEPVWISGPITEGLAVRDIVLVDGASQVEVSYEMIADSVEPY